ncbi:probable ATP-dependent RNA helicase DDX28 [Dermochelys coriacea]|uniref:probable ATP-dependent RNA helicase DDX28 n=1 Tax=Dermochelys coriacea TaxID=27794 RepID=UPI0018E85B54|nr:probable ATP-dependent RNA helicase DDX28 [Dermochelys coriacea]
MALSKAGVLMAAPGELALALGGARTSAARLLLVRWVQGGGPQPPENVVRIPRALRLRLAREPRRRGREVPVVPTRAGKLLLRSRRPQLSQPRCLTLGRWERPLLVSAGWKHRRACGDYFQLERSQEQAPALAPQPPRAAGGDASFQALGLGPALVSALRSLSITQPTAVQRRAIPALLRGGNALCAAETGSGKTLAYLLPLFQKLLSRPALGPAWPPSPRSLVLLPSRELAEQVRSVASSLGRSVGVRVREIGGGRGMASVKNQLRSDPDADLLVSTPGALCKALRKRMVRLERLCCLVLDEADTLLDSTFLDLVEEVLMQAPIAHSPKEVADQWDIKTQLVIVGATFPEGLGQLLSKVTNLGRFTTLTSQNLHHLLPHVKQKFIRLKGSDKSSELLQLIKDQGPSSGALLIFCNNASTVNWLGYILDDHKIKHLRLQGQMPAAMRAGIFTTFQKGQRDVLICTDLASRGLDTSRVELVVNYDFPSTLQDYLHRVGRVGRVGSAVPGTVVSFVTHRWDVDLVRKIETAARRRTCLPGMETAIKEPLPKTDLTPADKQ